MAKDPKPKVAAPAASVTATPAVSSEAVSTPTKSKKLVTKGKKPSKGGGTSLTQTDPLLQAYLREVQRYPLLTREEEHELAVRMFENKDREALQKLVTSNLRFVVKIAFEYVHYRNKLLDLIQEGNMGLVKAVQDFNPYKDVRLTTYAVWWIRSYIQDSILKGHSLVKLGTTQTQKRLFYRLRQEQKKLDQENVQPGDRTKLLAARLDVREKDIEEMDRRLSSNDVSLSVPASPDEKRQPLQTLADPGERIDDTLGDAEQKQIFSRILAQFAASLEGREKVVFEQRLTSETPMTLQELGDKYGVTKERARQIEEAIKKKLREYMRQHYPDYEILTESI